MSDLRKLIKTWRGPTGAPSHVTGQEWNGYRDARTRCADELERALAAQPAPMSRNDAFNLADTVADHYACGRPEEARQAIMAMAAQPATVPEGWGMVPKEIDHDMAAACNSVADMTEGDPEDHRYDDGFSTIQKLWDAMLAAAPSPDHSVDANRMVPNSSEPPNSSFSEAQAGADDSHYSVIFEAVKASVREIASSRGWQSLGLRDQEYIAGRVMRDLAAAMPKPAEGGAVDRGFAHDLNVFLNLYRAHLPQEAMAESYSLANRANAITWETAHAGSGEPVPLPEPFGWLVADRAVGFRFSRDEPIPEVTRAYLSGPVFSPSAVREYAETVAAPLRERLKAMEDDSRSTEIVYDLAVRLQTAERERDEARRDAERYRWLRKFSANSAPMPATIPVLVWAGQYHSSWLHKLDAAIDSAMGDDNAD